MKDKEFIDIIDDTEDKTWLFSDFPLWQIGLWTLAGSLVIKFYGRGMAFFIQLLLLWIAIYSFTMFLTKKTRVENAVIWLGIFSVIMISLCLLAERLGFF